MRIVAIAAGSEHSAALSDDHTLYTWGDNTYGQLGGSEDEVGVMDGVLISNWHRSLTATVGPDGIRSSVRRPKRSQASRRHRLPVVTITLLL